MTTRDIVLLVSSVLEFSICIIIVIMFSHPQELTVNEKFFETNIDRSKMSSIYLGWYQMICIVPDKFKHTLLCDNVIMQMKENIKTVRAEIHSFYNDERFLEEYFYLKKNRIILSDRYWTVRLCELNYATTGGDTYEDFVCWADPWLKIVTTAIFFTTAVTVVDFVVVLTMCITDRHSFWYEITMGIVWSILGILWLACVVLCGQMFHTKWPYQYKYLDGTKSYFHYNIPTMYYIGLGFESLMMVVSFVNFWRFFRKRLPETAAEPEPPVVVCVPPNPQVCLPLGPMLFVQPSPVVCAPPSPQGYDASVTPPMGTPQQMHIRSKSTGPQDRPANYSPPSSPSKVSEKGRLSLDQQSSPSTPQVPKVPFLDIITEPELELKFSLPNYSIDTVDVILHNPNVNYVLAFKISVTYPNDFLLEPESGIIDAGSKCIVRITKKAGNVSQRNDKAVLTYTKLPQGSPEISDKTFENKSVCKEKELVVLRPVF